MTGENENSTTELLCNILRVKYLRDIVLQYIGIPSKMLEEISQSNITTQAYDENTGILDIQIASLNCFYIIENKIRTNTVLQESQKSKYIEKIDKSGKVHRGLIFMIPEGYNEKEEIERLKKELDSQGKNYIIIKAWREFLEYLDKIEIGKDSPVIKESLDYLNDIILTPPVDYTLTIQEINIFYNPKNIYCSLSLLHKYFGLIDENEEYLMKQLGKDFDHSDWQKDFETVNKKGKNIRYKDRVCIFYGFNFNLLEAIDDNKNKYIFSICFELAQLKENPKIGEKYTFMKDENWLYIKTDISNIINDHTGKEYFNELIDIIKNVFLINLKKTE